MNKRKTENNPKLVILGGFLGAGKTTTLLELGKKLVAEHEKRVVFITNDQGQVLVDTRTIRKNGFPVSEVTQGCFCCNFSEFIAKCQEFIDHLKPDVIFAEPVGSCTDLISTIFNPICKQKAISKFDISPLIVLVDPIRVMAIPKQLFSDATQFLATHQIKEADIIVINKIDILSKQKLKKVTEILKEINNDADIITISAKEKIGLNTLLKIMMINSYIPKNGVDIDYMEYGKAEAYLGWFNGSCKIRAKSAENKFNPYKFVKLFMEECATSLWNQSGEITHFKTYFSDKDTNFKMSMTSHDDKIDFSPEIKAVTTEHGRLIINARVGLEPDCIDQCIFETLCKLTDKTGIDMSEWYSTKFRPSQPKPKHHDNLYN